MSADEFKSQLKELHQKRASLEDEISPLMARLEASGVGLKGSLIDEEGFPRADIDIPQIRADRQKVIMLSNDHKELSTQMEILLHRLHAISRNEVAPSSTSIRPPAYNGGGTEVEGVVGISVEARSNRPFAIIDEVSDHSPASEAGFQVGDALVQFGHVTAQTPNALQAMAGSLVENRPVEVQVLRKDSKVHLVVVPKQWSGHGLLGCHIRPI